MIDERLERELERAARPAAPDVGALVNDVVRRRARRATARRIQAGAVALVVTAAAFGAFVVVQARTTATVAPGGSPSSTVPQTAPPLRLGFPTCDVTSVPITVDGTHGFAYVATKTGDAGPCPKDADTVVAVDVNGDGRADAAAGPFGDCSYGCTAWAAPDVNGDGTSEVAVSNAGADGYGISLYAVTGGADPSIRSITVADPDGLGFIRVDPRAYDPMQFAWVASTTVAVVPRSTRTVERTAAFAPSLSPSSTMNVREPSGSAPQRASSNRSATSTQANCIGS